jgi:hypothetical protein
MSDKGEYPNFWVIAGLLVVVGLVLLFGFRERSGRPECDGQDMNPGDECVSVGRGDWDTASYSEMEERQRGSDLAQLAGGALALAGGGVAVFAIVRRHPFPGV